MTCARPDLYFTKEDTGTQKGKPTGDKRKARIWPRQLTPKPALTILSEQTEHWPQALALPGAYVWSQPGQQETRAILASA